MNTSAPSPATFLASDSSFDAIVRPEPSESEAATALLRRIDLLLGKAAPGRLVGPDGVTTEIPASVMQGLRRVAEAMAQGRAVTVAPHDPQLTTQAAAELLHVSRPHLIKLLERGELAYHRTSDDPAAHRRLLLRDVLAYRSGRREDRRRALADLTAASQAEATGGYR